MPKSSVVALEPLCEPSDVDDAPDILDEPETHPRTELARGERVRPPSRRACERLRFEIGGVPVYVQFGFMPNGALCEIFLDVAKRGSDINSMFDTIARTTSLYLQIGGSLDAIIRQWRDVPSNPAGFVTSDAPGFDVEKASSPLDAIAQYLENLNPHAPECDIGVDCSCR